MGSEEDYYDFNIEQLIIDMVRSRPTLYDKSLEEYHTEYRDERKVHL